MPDQVISVLEKYKENTSSNTSKLWKSSSKKQEVSGLKKSAIDTVLKQLKGINLHGK